MNSRLFALTLVTALGAAVSASAGPGTCAFHYTDKIKREIVEPIIVMHLQANGEYRHYDWNRPTISRKGRNVQLLIGYRGPAIDTSYIGILIEPCHSKLLDWYWVSPFPVVGPSD